MSSTDTNTDTVSSANLALLPALTHTGTLGLDSEFQAMGPSSHPPGATVGSKRASPSNDCIEVALEQTGRSEENEAHSEDSSCGPLEDEKVVGDADKVSQPGDDANVKSDPSGRSVRRRTSR